MKAVARHLSDKVKGFKFWECKSVFDMTTEDVINTVLENFDFLIRELDFGNPDITRHNTYFSIAYIRDDLGIEIQVELMQFFIYVLLFKPCENKASIAYKDSLGITQKRHLQEILLQLSVITSPEIKEIQQLGENYRNCDALASKLSNLLRKNWENIMTHKKHLFPKK